MKWIRQNTVTRNNHCLFLSSVIAINVWKERGVWGTEVFQWSLGKEGGKDPYKCLKTKSLDAERLLLLLLVEWFCIYENSKLSLNDSEDISVAVLIANQSAIYMYIYSYTPAVREIRSSQTNFMARRHYVPEACTLLFVPMSHVSDINVTPRILIFIISMFHFFSFQSITTGQRTEIEH